MDKQTIEFLVKKTDNIVTKIGKSCVSHPEIHFSGGSIKWYKDKPKQQHSNKNGWMVIAGFASLHIQSGFIALYNKETIESIDDRLVKVIIYITVAEWQDKWKASPTWTNSHLGISFSLWFVWFVVWYKLKYIARLDI